MIFALYERPEGIAVAERSRIVYDLERDIALRGPARVDGPAVAWALHTAEDELASDRYDDNAALAVEVELDSRTEWLVRCDRVDFPPRGIAYRHVHPGPGIRRLLSGELTIEAAEEEHTYRAGEAWFEDADYPVRATASPTEGAAFVRVLLLPREWERRRTIRHLDPADDDKPKLQRAGVLLEEPLGT